MKSASPRPFSMKGVGQKSCNKIGSTRLLTSRAGPIDRYVLDARHFQGVIHLKIADLSEEIERLHRQYKDAQQEYTSVTAYQTKAKELAKEITHLQNKLGDMNIAFDFVSTVKDVEIIEGEAKELEKINISEKEKIEALFCERKSKEHFIERKEMNKLENKINDTSEDRERLDILNSRLSQSSKAVVLWKKKIASYSEIRSKIIKGLQSRFPCANEVIELENDFLRIKRKQKEMVKNSTSAKHNEQKPFFEMVKDDTREISVMEHSIDEINKKIKTIEGVKGHLPCLRENEDASGKGIDVYLKNFDSIKDQKINRLKDLETELNNLLIDISQNMYSTDFLNTEENKLDVEDIQDGSGSIQHKYFKTLRAWKKMELMAADVTQKCEKLEEKLIGLKEELDEYETLFKLKTSVQERENKLRNEILDLQKGESKRLEDLEKAKIHHQKLNQELSENNRHKVILQLEEKICNLERGNNLKKQEIAEIKKVSINLMEIRNGTLNLIEVFNKQLINNSGAL